MAATNTITQARLKELLHYEPETGVLTRLTNRGGKKAGDVAGSINRTGYRQIKIDSVLYLAHRLIFLYMLGYMPNEVDHDNQVKDDNRWENLNPATHLTNCKNQPLRRNNTSGHIGVDWHKRIEKWASRIRSDGKDIHLGYFTHKADAIAARQAAEIKYGFHENHGKLLCNTG